MRYLGILLALILLTARCKPDVKNEADLYSGVPQSSVVLIETRNIEKAFQEITQTKIYLDADSLPLIQSFRDQALALKNLFPADTLQRFLNNRKVLISTSLSGAGKYDMLFLTTSDKDFERISGQSLANQYTFKKKTYAEAEVFTFFDGDHEKFSLSSYRNVLLFSTSINLVEEAIRQLNSDFNFRANPEFEKLYNTANKKDLANLYVRMAEVPAWLKKSIPLAELGFLSKTGKWAELDLQVYNKELLINGILLLPEEEGYFTHAFRGTEPQKPEAADIIPAGAALWLSYSFENAEEYHRNYEEYLKVSESFNRYQQQLASLPSGGKEAVLNWVDTEMGLIYTDAAVKSNFRIAYFKHRKRSLAEESLETISDSSYIEGYRGLILKKLAYENMLPKVYGRLFKGLHKPYYTVLEDFVIFSESEAAMKGLINDLLAGKTLAADESYQEFIGKVPSKSHIRALASNPLFLDLMMSKLEGADAQILERSRDVLNNYRWASLQLNVEGDAAFVNFYLLNEPKTQEEVARQWATVLESPAQGAPQFVLNHGNKKYEIIIQDSDNRLYLVDGDGKIVWTKMLDGPLLGTVTQVDLFKNNKLQMVCNTAQSLYVIDRLGRDVEKFPVKLPVRATAAVGVFNYDRARNYRFVVPAGNKLLNYDKEGKPVSGWAFKKADSDLISKPQLFTINKKDVIVCLSEKGSLYLLDRRGNGRFKTVTGLEGLNPPFYFREGDKLKESELLTLNKKGQMVAIGINGTIDALYLDENNPAEHFLYFDDKYIFTHDEELFVKSDEKPWQAELESEISDRPKAMIFRREFYVGAYSKNAEQVVLFDKQGQMIKGFPVFAQSPFDMGSLKQDGAINIVTSTEDGTLICYRVN
ncbi:MAG TPA: hypothetical protein DIU20_03705 [Cryomorphaceae bacterium]|nr:hypothetical protein [Cryomorphaceae bacterium]